MLSDARPQVPAQQFWYTAREKCENEHESSSCDDKEEGGDNERGAGDVRGLVLESVLDPGHTGVPHGVEHTRVRPRVCGPPHAPLQEPHGPHVDHAGGTAER